jgi:hypothetical protein
VTTLSKKRRREAASQKAWGLVSKNPGMHQHRKLRQRMSLLACTALLAIGTVQAKADDTVSVQEVRDLKARLKMLEQRLDAQAKAQKQINAYQTQGPLTKGGVPVAYEPPQPWDKKWHMNGITITPGGFLAMEGVWRSRDQGADIGDQPFGAIPFPNSELAHTNELRFSARQSRVSALVEGDANPATHISGYGELDFLGAGNTANSNESNSYNPRIRHLYMTSDWNDIGLHLLAGQTWSLVTMNNKGITPRNEIVPLTIDAQYVAGFTWARQPGIRLTKNFGDDFWLAASAEMPQTPGCPGGLVTPPPGGGIIPPTAFTTNGVGLAITCDQVSAGGGLLNQYTTYSLNHVPDIIGKTVWEPNLGDRRIHLEAFGLYTDVYDRVSNATPLGAATSLLSFNSNRDTAGWGAGGGLIVPVLPRLLDIQASGMVGRGIGRYGTSQLGEVVANPDGSLDPLPEAMFLGGAILHATPQLDIYAYGGGEKILSPQIFTNSTAPGYGNPFVTNNSGCNVEFGTCNGSTKDAWEVTTGFWDKIYEGSFGSLRFGLQYAYIQRELYPGIATAAVAGVTLPANFSSPKTNVNTVSASLRYYPFDVPPPAPPLLAKY